MASGQWKNREFTLSGRIGRKKIILAGRLLVPVQRHRRGQVHELCDVSKALLARSSVNDSVQHVSRTVPAQVRVSSTEVVSHELPS